jgi:hypothetical protein
MMQGRNGGNGGGHFPLKKASVREQMAETAAVAESVARLQGVRFIFIIFFIALYNACKAR